MKRIAQFAIAMALAGAVHAAGPTIDWSQPVGYLYDGSGNVKHIGVDLYRYDTAGRLVRAHTNGVRREYSYDAYGNRLTCAHDPATDCQYGHTINSATNRVNQVGYDAAGRVGSYLNHTYSYDAVNMPVLDDGPFEDREFIYTADDERLAVYTVGAQNAWHWTIRDASGKVLRELRSTNAPDGTPAAAAWTWERDHVWRDGQLAASRQIVDGAPTTYHYHLDHLGTPRRVTDANDHIVGAHDYHAFGVETSGSTSEPSGTSLKYTSHERDGASTDPATLDYMHARYYSAALGRFLTVDPVWHSADLGLPQSWNRYSYVRNNPVLSTDPDGRVCWPCVGGAVGFTVGIIAGGAYETYQVAVEHRPVKNSRILAFGAAGAVFGASLGSTHASDIGDEQPRPSEAYDRQKHYGRTPSAKDRKDLGAGSDEVVNHEPPLVERYYDGDPASGEKPGYQMTPEERRQSANDRSRMNLQPTKESCQQGAECAQYSREKKKEFALDKKEQ